MTDPTVAVIIPCFNGRAYIEEAINSVYSQTKAAHEVIVVDDGFTDGSWELVLKLKETRYTDLKVLCHPGRENLGPSSSRMRGFAQTSCKYVAFLDADDIFFPRKLELQVAALERFPKVVLCHTGVEVMGDKDLAGFFEYVSKVLPGTPYRFRSREDYLECDEICASSVLIRAEALRNVHFAVKQLFQFEDWLCLCLLAAKGDFIFLRDKLTSYRIHEKSSTYLAQGKKLMRLYALLELKLALLARCESSWHAVRVFFYACETVRQILVEYLWDPTSPGDTGRKIKLNFVVMAIMAWGKIVRSIKKLIQRGKPT